VSSKWISEEVWIDALRRAEAHKRHLSEHTCYNKLGVLDKSYSAQLVARAQMRRDRIFAAGEPSWQQRYRKFPG
jgi:hypothetical protein